MHKPVAQGQGYLLAFSLLVYGDLDHGVGVGPQGLWEPLMLIELVASVTILFALIFVILLRISLAEQLLHVLKFTL